MEDIVWRDELKKLLGVVFKKSDRAMPTRVVPVELGIVEAGFDCGPFRLSIRRPRRSSLWSAYVCARATPQLRAWKPACRPSTAITVSHPRQVEDA